MSPSLSRENFFLTIINQFDEHGVKPGSLEYTLQQLILDIAETVRSKSSLHSDLICRINRVFQEYQAVQLKVGLASQVDLAPMSSSYRHSTDEEQQIVLYTEFIDEPHQWKRLYMEALISLLEAIEKNRLELQRCIQCEAWFIPYQRAQVTKFCSSKCRNRYNYVMRTQKEPNISKEEMSI